MKKPTFSRRFLIIALLSATAIFFIGPLIATQKMIYTYTTPTSVCWKPHVLSYTLLRYDNNPDAEGILKCGFYSWSCTGFLHERDEIYSIYTSSIPAGVEELRLATKEEISTFLPLIEEGRRRMLIPKPRLLMRVPQ